MFNQMMEFDLAFLAEPLSAEAPCGADLRQDASPLSAYFNLKDVRNSARAAERSALVDSEPLLSLANEWDPIIEQVPSLLLETSKDLELAAWLIEALVRRHGFKGLRIGFDIARVLIESHWEGLFPRPDEDGLVTRVAPLIGLNGTDGDGTLIMPIACVPLTALIADQPYSLWEFEQASEVERLDADKRKKRHNAGAAQLEKISNAVKATEGSFFVELLEDIESASAAYQQLSIAIDQAIGDPQPSSNITKRLNACADAVRFLAGDKLAAAELQIQSAKAQAELHEERQDAEGSAPAPGAQLDNRSQAINQLVSIADFFKRTEPHSPMAYAIEQVVRWSDMTLPDLLQELISDNEARKGYFRLTGIAEKQQD
jgi:type VI secretion system protein ImpA